MTDDSTERVGSSFVASSLTVTSSSEGAETSSPWGGEGAWATGIGTNPWSSFVARRAMTDVPSEGGDKLFLAPSLVTVASCEGAKASPSWEGGDAWAPVIEGLGFWASNSGVLWVSFGELGGDAAAPFELSEGLDPAFFPETW